MVARVRVASPEVALARILQALEAELIDASSAEIVDAAKELGMNLQTKESAAFRGLTYPSQPQWSDFFELEWCRTLADLLPHGPGGARSGDEASPGGTASSGGAASSARTRSPPKRKGRQPKRPGTRRPI